MSSTVLLLVLCFFPLDSILMNIQELLTSAFPKIGFLAPPPDNSTSGIEFQSDDVTKMILLKLW